MIRPNEASASGALRTMRGIPLLFFLVLPLLLVPPSSAQVATGTPPFGSFSGGPEIINNANLNALWKFAVLHKPGRGQNFEFDLIYNTSIWYPVGASGNQTWQLIANWGWSGSAVRIGRISYSVSEIGPFSCAYHKSRWTYVYSWSYTDGWGAVHKFSGTSQVIYNQCTGNSTTSLVSRAVDGSGYVINVTGSSVNSLYDSLGNLIWSGYGVEDRNGNEITESGNVFTDTLGTSALTISGTAPSPVSYSYTAPSGAAASYTVRYSTFTVQTNFGCSGIVEYPATSNNLVSEIDLPDGSKYTFSYEQTPGAPSNVTGRLAKVTLPTGGYVSYSYSGGNNGVICADGSTSTLQRTVNDGTNSNTWTYTHSESGTAWNTLITDPQNNQTNMNFQGIYETQRQVYQGSTSGTLLRQGTTCYNGNTSNCNGTPVGSITQRAVIDQYGSNGPQCQHNYFYDSGGGLTEQDDYDYGSGGPGALLRKTLITYASLGNITAFRQTVTICNGTGSNSSCAGPSGGSIGTVVSQTNYNYDEPNTLTATSGIAQHTSVSGSRGNLTSISYPVSGLTSHFTYYDTGSPNTSQDVNSATTTYSYSSASCQMAFPTSISEPLNMTRSMTWNCTGGVLTSLTDENNQVSSVTYNDAYYWRPNGTTDQLGNQTAISYQPNPTYCCPWMVASALSFNNGNSLVEDVQYKDGLGRTYVDQHPQGPNSSTLDSVSYTFDSNGRPYSISMPCSIGYAGTCSTPKTTQTYDALNRPLQTTDAGGGTVTYSYSQNDVLVTVGPAPSGENTKQRQLEYDALGRLTSVCELTAGTSLWPSASCGQNTAATGYLTKYTYDALGNLLTVTQNAQSGSNQQTRSYASDAMGRLTSETNPESGTTTYVYDTIASGNCAGTYNGDLIKKVDAAGNVTCTVYDALHRPTSVTYPSGPNSSSSVMKVFYYDTSHFNTTYNTKGRLASAGTCSNPTCAGPWITAEDFSYSARGDLTDIYELTPNSGGWYHVTQTYWPHGAPSQLSGLPGLPTISYGGTIGSTVGLDGEGRITQVTASSGQNPVTGVSYNTASLPTQVNLGSGDSDIFAYDANTLRMNQYQFRINGQYVTSSVTWNANGSLGQLAITDPFNSANTQTCNYAHDDVARIAQVDCGTSNWGQSFAYISGQNQGYDPFGNLTKYVLSNHTGNSFQPTYNSATNRFSSIPGCSALSYDNNGNVLNDCNHTYAWDADGNSVTVDSVGLTFDALDRVVEQNRSGSYTQIVYAPTGAKLALMNGQTLQRAYIRLPGTATAVYTATAPLDHYQHADWLGSSRLGSQPYAAPPWSETAYAPFGEPYAQSGATDLSFTGQNSDTSSGDYDFLAREYSTQGRWASPDPAGLAAVDPSSPQSWNRYSYVLNNPLALIDPLGLDCTDTVNEDGSINTVCTVGGGGSGVPPGICIDPSCAPTQSSGNLVGGGGSTIGPSTSPQLCFEPRLLQKIGITVQGWLAKLTNKTIGVGAGISGAAGNRWGAAFTLSQQVVVSPNGQAAFATTYTSLASVPFAYVSPGYGGYGGLQLSVSNATTPQDLGGVFINGGLGAGKGWGGGVDLAVGTGTQGQFIWQATATGPAGYSAPGAVGHGASFNNTTITPICKN